MRRINDHEVELTDHELACLDAHGMYLDQGNTTLQATRKVCLNHDPLKQLTPEFVAYLNE